MNLHQDEPTFTLRASDAMAPWAVLDWSRNVLQNLGSGRAQFRKAAQAHQRAIEMLEWQGENPDKVKMPD